MTPQTMEELLIVLDTRMDIFERKIDRLLFCWEQRQETCPYRDRVIHNTAEIVLHHARLSTIESLVLDMRLASARAGMVGGISGAAVTSIVAGVVYGVGKVAGWW